MRTGRKFLLAAPGVCAITLAWGYWHLLTHASLGLTVRDHGMKSGTLAYGTPHDVTITFLGPANEPLAVARSVEREEYILAVHPDGEIGNCQHRRFGAAAGQASHGDHAKCYAVHSAWAARWAPQVRRANVTVGACALQGLPVQVRASNDEWWLWWVPLPHVGGVPYRYFEFSLDVDSRACAGVGRQGPNTGDGK